MRGRAKCRDRQKGRQERERKLRKAKGIQRNVIEIMRGIKKGREKESERKSEEREREEKTEQRGRME